MPAIQTTLTWAQTAALNPRTPICASCGAALTHKAANGALCRCRSCRSRSPLSPLLSFPRPVDHPGEAVARLAA